MHRDTGKRRTRAMPKELLGVEYTLNTVSRSRVCVDMRAGVETRTNMECSEGAWNSEFSARALGPDIQ